MDLFDLIKNTQFSRQPVQRMVYKLLIPFWLVKRFMTDGTFRSAKITKWRFGKRYFQQSSYTKADRYPKVFAAVAHYLQTLPIPQILSYGCSTGEEVLTLSNYMPDALITGVDINESCIKHCQSIYRNPNFNFCHSLSENFLDSTAYDAIFCMAVFQHTDNRRVLGSNTAKSFTFSQFENEVIKLDKKLKVGGLFVIDHSDFSFTDTCVSSRYLPLEFSGNRIERRRPLFDRNNLMVASTQISFRVFVKGEE